MGTIGSLGVNVFADINRFTAPIRAARAELPLFSSGVGLLNRQLIGLGSTLAAGFTIGALRGTLDKLDDMADSADRLGVNVDKLAGLAHAAFMTDVSQGTLFRSLTLMEKNVAAGGKVFGELGLNVDDLKHLEADQMFLAIADQINRLPTPTEQTAAALKIFGRNAGELMELVRQGRPEIEATADEWQRWVGTIDPEKIDRAKDAINRLAAAFEALKASIVLTLAEPLADFFDEAGRRLAVDVENLHKLQRGLVEIDLFMNRFMLAANDKLAAAAGVSKWATILDVPSRGVPTALLGRLWSNWGTKRQDTITRIEEGQRALRGLSGGVSGTPGAGGVISGAAGIAGASSHTLPDMSPAELHRISNAVSVMLFDFEEEVNRRIATEQRSLSGGVGFSRPPSDTDPAELARIDRLVSEFVDSDLRSRKFTRPAGIGTTPTGGFRALEAGTAEAFSQARRSQEAAKGLDVQRQQLDEAKRQTAELMKIDAALKTADDTEIVNIV